MSISREEVKKMIGSYVEKAQSSLISKILTLRTQTDAKIEQIEAILSTMASHHAKANEELIINLKSYTDSHIDEFIRQERSHEERIYTVYDIIKANEEKLIRHLSELNAKIGDLEFNLFKKAKDGCEEPSPPYDSILPPPKDRANKG